MMQIYDMKVNHLSNPLGFRLECTVFSWKVKEAKGKRQEAARIQIALDEQMENLLLDTGFEQDADSLGWKLDLKLKPCTRYYWTVTIRSDVKEEQISEVQWFETGKKALPWQARWITCDKEEPRHPFFEKEIIPDKQVESARLYICGLGLYEVFYTDAETGEEMQRIGEEYLTPYCNNYQEWVQYQTFDVTEYLQKRGTLSILLGNGWYKGRFGLGGNDAGFYGDEWKLLAELCLTYSDGTNAIIGTDESWGVRRSKITFSNLYDGEWRDDTLEELPREHAVLCDAPKGELTERMSLPVKIQEIFEPISLIDTPVGEKVFDMGQEFTGIFALKVKEPRGTKIHIQTGEILQGGNFYRENLRTAKSEYIYISDGTEKVIAPHFTFYGYRYVKIQGISNLKKEDFHGYALYSEMKATGEISTGHGLVNQFLSNVKWGMKSNFLDVPTDCPQRDERLGWTGDAQVFSPTAMYLMDSYAFYAKYLYDMTKEQRVMKGKVPDVIPSFGTTSTACVWGDAACIIPWNLYRFYGDRQILEDQFESMKSWVDYIRKVDGKHHGWGYLLHFGDWLALDHPKREPEQVLGGTDEEFIANLYYAVSAEIVGKVAGILGFSKEKEIYQRLAETQFDYVKQEYYSATGRCCIKTQTALILTLKYKLSSNEELTKKQLRQLFDINDGKLCTGFVGTPLLCNVLSEYGMDDLAYQLLLNEEYPGWLREVKLGATTVWERWNSILDDGTISGTSMNSMNHYSYGSVVEWVFRHAAGICAVDTVPGFRKVLFQPVLNWKFRKIEAAYESPAGMYRSHWEMSDEKHVTLSVSVPFGCTAILKLPQASPDIYKDSTNPMFQKMQGDSCLLEAGDYTISYELAELKSETYSVDTPIGKLCANPVVREILKKKPELQQIPMHHYGLSIRQRAAQFGGMEENELMALDALLKQISRKQIKR